MFENIQQDIKRYMLTDDVSSYRSFINMLLTNPSLWVICSYRLGRWVRRDCRIPIARDFLKLITKIIHEILCLLTGIQIRFEATIGPGLYIGHTGTLIVSNLAVIGSNCNIGTDVVIGQGGRKGEKGAPVIGNQVFIGVGAKIIGNIMIGDNVAVGANAVVNKNVPPHTTVAGIPARIINQLGSTDLIRC